jgi:uncharacterized protein (TIGR02246 family)
MGEYALEASETGGILSMVSRWLARLALAWTLILAITVGTFGASMENADAATQEASMQAQIGIERTMAAYNAALNGGGTVAVLPLYTEEGVFMAPYNRSYVGRANVQAAYDAVFRELKFDVKFDIAEIVVMSPRWAFVRTNSAGTTVHHSTGETTSEANQELFVLEKGDDDAWRIARYSFSPTNPPGP